MEPSGIYSIVHHASGKCYVGSAINIRQRFWDHQSKLRRGIHYNRKLQRAWNKYGESAFTFMVLEYVDDRLFLLAREQCWIDRLKVASRGGYNIAPMAGSPAGYRHTRSVRVQMSLSRTGRVMSQETKNKIALAHIGRKRAPFSSEWRKKLALAGIGRVVSPATIEKIVAGRRWYRPSAETKRKISLAVKTSDKCQQFYQSCVGHGCSTETRAKISAANTGRKRTQEVRAKMSAALKGRSRPAGFGDKIRMAQRGKKHTPERCRNMSLALNGRKGIVITPEIIAKRIATRRRNRELQETTTP